MTPQLTDQPADPVARLLLGGTGEAMVRGAYCSLLIVPRPETES